MKSLIRILGIDDGPFKFSDKTVPVVGVVMRGGYIDGVMRTEVRVDGDEATEVVIDLLEKSRFKEQVRVLIIDGVALGGFNIVDLEEVNKRTGVPCISVTREKPDFEAMKKVLRSKFADWERRWAIVGRGDLFVVDTGHKPIHVRAVGMTEKEAAVVLRRSILRGALPEAIRVAHIIATAFVRGESKGNA